MAYVAHSPGLDWTVIEQPLVSSGGREDFTADQVQSGFGGGSD